MGVCSAETKVEGSIAFEVGQIFAFAAKLFVLGFESK